MGSPQDDRLQIQVDGEEKRPLGRAAEAPHRTGSAFVLQAAALHAEPVLAEDTTLRLSPEAAEAFSEALARPARVNTHLAKALTRPRQFRWLG